MNLAPTASAHASRASGAAPDIRLPTMRRRSGGGAIDPSGQPENPSAMHAVMAWLFGGSTPMDDERARAAAGKRYAEANAAERDLQQFTSGVPIPQRPTPYDPASDLTAGDEATANPTGAPSVSVFGSQTPIAPRVPMLNRPAPVVLPTRSPMADAMGGKVDMKAALPFLMRLAPDRAKQAQEMIAAAQPKPKQLANGGDGYLGAFDAEAGTLSPLHDGRPKHEWKEVRNADGSSRFIDLLDPSSGDQPPTGSAGAPTPTAIAPVPTGGIYAHVGQIAQGKGAVPDEVSYLQRLAHVESHGDPSAQNNSSTGLFQFHPDTFASAGGGNIHNVTDQTVAALNLSRRDRANLQALNIEPTDANVYIMHQQGAGGGRALLTAPPETNAVSALTPFYGSAETAKKAIVGNGGTPDMTAGQFTDMWRRRWANGGKPVAAQAAPASAQSVPRGIPGSAPKGPEWATLSPQESAALGPGQYQKNLMTGEVKQVSGTAPKGAGAFKLSPQDSKYLSGAREAAQQLHNTAPLIKRFLQLNSKVGTGGAMGLGVVSGSAALLDPRVAEMKAISDRLTPAMRQGMPGAASDRDVAMFQSATVGIRKPGPANTAVGRALVAAADRQGGYVAFLEDYAKKNGSLLGAQEEWDAYAAANPMFDEDGQGNLIVRKQQPWREFFGESAPGSARATPSRDQRLSPEEAAKLPPGTSFVGLDGVPRVRH